MEKGEGGQVKQHTAPAGVRLRAGDLLKCVSVAWAAGSPITARWGLSGALSHEGDPVLIPVCREHVVPAAAPIVVFISHADTKVSSACFCFILRDKAH